MVFDQLEEVKDIQYDINRAAVWALLGYKKGKTKLPQRMVELVDSSFREAQEMICPIGAYIFRRIDKKKTEISLLATDTTIEGNSAQKLLRNSFAVILMAVTIGPELESRISQYAEEKQFEKSLVLDAIGSEAAEASINALNFYLLGLARQAKIRLTKRFSPGYGDLPLKFQKDLESEMAFERLGISVDSLFILTPRKTVTAIIGVEE